MKKKLILEWRESKKGISELFMNNGISEINCNELVKDHCELNHEDAVVLLRDECQALNFTHEGKMLVLLYDGSSYFIVDENGKFIFENIDFIQFDRSKNYFTILNEELDQYCIYYHTTDYPEFTSNSPIEYYHRFDIFIIDGEFGSKVIHEGEEYNISSVVDKKTNYIDYEHDNEVILTDLYDYDEDSILIFASKVENPKNIYLENYNVIPLKNGDWLIINQCEGYLQIISKNKRCIDLSDDLTLKALQPWARDVIFEIEIKQTKEKFLVIDNFQNLLKTKIHEILPQTLQSNIIENTPLFLSASEYFIFQNKPLGDFLLIYSDSKIHGNTRVTIFWTLEEPPLIFEVPNELSKNPLLCLQYGFVDQSSLKQIKLTWPDITKASKTSHDS